MHHLRIRGFYLCLLLLISVSCSSPPQTPTVRPPQNDPLSPATPTAQATTVSAPSVTENAPSINTTGSPSPTASPTDTPVPTQSAPAADDASPEAPTVALSGRTADGAYFLGREDAPLTIVDYSDFL